MNNHPTQPQTTVTGNLPVIGGNVPAIDPKAIKQVDGLYCINDLHKMAGGKKKDSPYYFFRSETAIALIAELEREQNAQEIKLPQKRGSYINRVIGKGKRQGTYVCKELVYAYATWISPAFYLTVIRVFDRLMMGQTYTERVNLKTKQVSETRQELSYHASRLAIDGKKTLPKLEQELESLLAEQQLTLKGL